MSSRSLNKVTLIGNLTRDPEMRYTPQGTAVTTFGLATNRSWKTEAGELRDEVEFHRIVAWNKLAELCSQLLIKGRKVYVEGRLQTRTFMGSDNAQHTITEIVIEDMILLDSKRPEATVQPGGEANGQPAVSPPPPPVVASQTGSSDETKVLAKAGKKAKEAVEEEKDAASAEAPASQGADKEEKLKVSPVNEDVNVDDIPF